VPYVHEEHPDGEGRDLAAIAIVAIVVAVVLARRGHRLLFATSIQTAHTRPGSTSRGS
jgi:hypothetical protein